MQCTINFNADIPLTRIIIYMDLNISIKLSFLFSIKPSSRVLKGPTAVDLMKATERGIWVRKIMRESMPSPIRTTS